MTITVKIGEGNSELSDLVAKVEAGEDVLIAREGTPVARLTLIPARPDVEAAIESIRKSRAKLPRTTIEEILEWRDEGRR